jgi:phosphopantothenoylcysteine synthetase/decarboxylase
MSPKPTIIITAGGTVEPIDDVRAIINFSTGSVGLSLAKEALARGFSVELLLSRIAKGPVPEGVNMTPFGSAQHLMEILLQKISEKKKVGRVAVFHAAAVADYAPVKAEGKIPSDREELTLTLRKTPKIVDKIKPSEDPDLWLTSFKLLSRKDGRDVIEVARAQMQRTRSNSVVANYIEDVIVPNYKGWVLLADGTQREVNARDDLASAVLSSMQESNA